MGDCFVEMYLKTQASRADLIVSPPLWPLGSMGATGLQQSFWGEAGKCLGRKPTTVQMDETFRRESVSSAVACLYGAQLQPFKETF